jgi:hypothetical protein
MLLLKAWRIHKQKLRIFGSVNAKQAMTRRLGFA